MCCGIFTAISFFPSILPWSYNMYLLHICSFPKAWMSFSQRCTCELMVFAVLGAGRRGAVQQWLSQYLQILTGGSCSDMSVGQQILWNSAMVAVVLSLLHLVWHISPVNPSCLLFISPVLTLAVIKWHLDALRCLEVFQESCYSYFFSVASLLLCK